MALSWTLDKLGPFARSAEDCGLILHAIAGKDGKTRLGRQELLLHAAVRAAAHRIADRLCRRRFRRPPDAAARPAFAAALDSLKACGVQLVEATLPGSLTARCCPPFSAPSRLPSSSRSSPAARSMSWPTQSQIAGLKASLEIPPRII
jgi:aspartyl-tRNA(Asn)/glutamyl-tRNA(Gln) amidotransferase subunit A